MMPVRTITPVPLSLPVFSPTSFQARTDRPVGIALNKARFYGANGGALKESTNGTAWTTLYTFAKSVESMIETGDGEALVFCGTVGPGEVWKSSGWATNRATATWTKVKDLAAGAFIRGAWGGNCATFGDDNLVPGSGKYGFLVEYGDWGSAPDETKATHGYFTQDYGATWTQALDLYAMFPGKTAVHTHGGAYDPYWDTLWATYGDGAHMGDDKTKASISYSFDRGVTWQHLNMPPEWQNLAGDENWQALAVLPLPDCILIGSDTKPGWFRVPRIGYRQMGTPQVTSIPHGGTGNILLTFDIHHNRRFPADPVLMSMTRGSSTTNPIPTLHASLDLGKTMTEIFRDEAATGSSAGFPRVLGPLTNGIIAARTNDNRVLLGTLVTPPAGSIDMYPTVTGDGVQTVFPFPHNKGSVPTAVQLYRNSPSALGIAAPAVTFDATNVYLTYGAAPVNATNYHYGARVQ